MYSRKVIDWLLKSINDDLNGLLEDVRSFGSYSLSPGRPNMAAIILEVVRRQITRETEQLDIFLLNTMMKIQEQCTDGQYIQFQGKTVTSDTHNNNYVFATKDTLGNATATKDQNHNCSNAELMKTDGVFTPHVPNLSPAKQIPLLEILEATEGIWHLDINRTGAINCLNGRVEGAFIVRRSRQKACLALSVRTGSWPSNRSARAGIRPDMNMTSAGIRPYIDHYLIQRSRITDDRESFNLRGSPLRFSTLTSLVAHYMSTSGELPVTLKLPSQIMNASSQGELFRLNSHGADFWSEMSLNPIRKSQTLSVPYIITASTTSSPVITTYTSLSPVITISSSLSPVRSSSSSWSTSTLSSPLPVTSSSISPPTVLVAMTSSSTMTPTSSPPIGVTSASQRCSVRSRSEDNSDQLKARISQQFSLNGYRRSSGLHSTLSVDDCPVFDERTISNDLRGRESLQGSQLGPVVSEFDLSKSTMDNNATKSSLTRQGRHVASTSRIDDVITVSRDLSHVEGREPRSASFDQLQSTNSNSRFQSGSGYGHLGITPIVNARIGLVQSEGSVLVKSAISGDIVRAQKSDSKPVVNNHQLDNISDHKTSNVDSRGTRKNKLITANESTVVESIPLNDGNTDDNSLNLSINSKTLPSPKKSFGQKTRSFLGYVNNKFFSSRHLNNYPAQCPPQTGTTFVGKTSSSGAKPNRRRCLVREQFSRPQPSVENSYYHPPANALTERVNGSVKNFNLPKFPVDSCDRSAARTAVFEQVSVEIPSSPLTTSKPDIPLTFANLQRLSDYDNISRKFCGHRECLDDGASSTHSTCYSPPWDSSRWKRLLLEDGSIDPRLPLPSSSFELERRFAERPVTAETTVVSDDEGVEDDHDTSEEIISGGKNSGAKSQNEEISNCLLDLAHDSGTKFYANLKEFIYCTKQIRDPYVVIRNIRQFMDGMKHYLICTGEEELTKVVERERAKLIGDEFLNIDSILEDELCKCTIHPLKSHIYALFVNHCKRNNSLQVILENIRYAKLKTPKDLGIKPIYLPMNSSAIERFKTYIGKMKSDYSPIRKIENLLSAANEIRRLIEKQRAKPQSRCSLHFEADDFLLLIVYGLIESGLTSGEIEAEFMLGLLQPVSGERLHVLSYFFSAIQVLKSIRWLLERKDGVPFAQAIGDINGFVKLIVPNERNDTVIKMLLPVRPSMTVKDACCMIAHKFSITNPQDYCLFALINNQEEHRLMGQSCPQLVCNDYKWKEKDCVFVYKRTNAKFAWPIAINATQSAWSIANHPLVWPAVSKHS